MTQDLQNEPETSNQTNNDPAQPFSLPQALMERSVLACNHIHQFGTELLSDKKLSGEELRRFTLLPTEMIVAMHNLRHGIETALLTLAAMGLPVELKDKAKEIFIQNEEGVSTNLDFLFEAVIEKGGPEDFIAVADISIPAEIGIETDEYLGSLDFLKEMASKYQQYAFENVPKVMEGACNLGNKQPAGWPKSMKNPEETCSQLQVSQSSDDSAINPEEVVKYQKMCEELIGDANTIFGQFCAVGAIYVSALKL